MRLHRMALVCMAVFMLFSTGCHHQQVGRQLHRQGDEIMVCGQLFHTGAPVVLWTDPGGYDAYRVEKRFVPYEQAQWEQIKDRVKSPNRYGLRYRGEHFDRKQLEQIQGGGWNLPLLKEIVDQVVIHYDACGTSQRCFSVLHDERTLSAHFLLDLDGTIYQTLDLKERAWHASVANDRSIGIEIANVGAYDSTSHPVLRKWYQRDAMGRTVIAYPRGDATAEGIATPRFIARPVRNEPVRGVIHEREWFMYDLTPEQYDSLIKLTAALCLIFPELECDYPRDENGDLIRRALSEDELTQFQGLLGHFHITSQKIDPGPAFQWDKVIDEARRYLRIR